MIAVATLPALPMAVASAMTADLVMPVILAMADVAKPVGLISYLP